MWVACVIFLPIALVSILPELAADKALSTPEHVGSQLHSVLNGAAQVGNTPASNLISRADPTWPLLVAGPGPVFIWTKQLLTTLEEPHRLGRSTLLESCRTLGSEGQRLLQVGSISIKGDPCICKFVPFLELSKYAYCLCCWLTCNSLGEDLYVFFSWWNF